MSLELAQETKSAVWTGVYDVVNTTDPDLYTETDDLTEIGAPPICIQNMNNGVDFMVNALRNRVAKEGTIDLLRIHGHGIPGVQTISAWYFPRGTDFSRVRSIISYFNFEHIRASLMRLQGCFAPGAEVWLMGCEVGAKCEGLRTIKLLAKLWRVRVTAGVPTQYGGGVKTFRFEGRTETAYP